MKYATQVAIRNMAKVLKIDTEGQSIDAIRRQVTGRMAALKIGPECSRCWGSGRYSRNRRSSRTICYGCGGCGKSVPADPYEWQEAYDEAVVASTDGRLDDYLERKNDQ